MIMVSKDKAYIVANEEQERKVLGKLEQQGCSWNDTENTPPTEWHLGRYPYAIFVKYGKKLVWGFNVDVSEVEIVAEDKQDKFKISKEVYDGLVDWKHDTASEKDFYITPFDFKEIPFVVKSWWLANNVDSIGNNNRLIAIIHWVNGEDIFEIEKPKKWVVRSKDRTEQGSYLYVMLDISHGVKKILSFWDKDVATRFDTKEEAQSWANSHQEVVEVEE